jgi:aryl-alcohol dehydrogenase-like predicted oxidoreductase
VKLKPLGDTHLTVTPMGLGLAALGRPGYINLGHSADLGHDYDIAAMAAHAHTVLDAAWAAGIRYFDAARSYGRAEAFLDSWLRARDIPPEAVTVGSKWGYTYTADWQVTADKHEVKDHSLPVLRRQTAESRANLGRHLKLYQIHSATFDSGVLDNSDVLAELAQLRDEGLVIGLSLSGPNQGDVLRRALDIDVAGAPLFRAVQATWNLLAQEAGPALADAHARGMGIIVKEALANGRLTARNTAPEFAAGRHLLRQAADDGGIAIDTLALAAVLAQPWAGVVLSGAAKVEHLASNAAAVAVAAERGAWLAEWLPRLSALAEPAERYWQQRAALAWN